LKSGIKSENKDVEVRNEDKLTTFSINAKTTVTAKADEVKAIGKTLKEFRVGTEKQLNKKIKAESPLPPHFATTILFFSIFLFQFSTHLYQILRITILKHSPLEISAIAKCLVCHNRQLQSRRRPQ
jgi:hypothetical protein